MTHNKWRQRFFKPWIVCLVLFAWAFSAPVAVDALSATRQPDHIRLTWVQDAKTTQTVTWRTSDEVSEGWVRYFEMVPPSPATPVRHLAKADTARMDTQDGSLNVHSATLADLKPGVRYGYQVGGGDAWSEMESFTTAPERARDFDFLVFGDSQSIDYNVWRITVQNAFRTVPEAAFFVNVGDLVDVGQDYGEWERWFAGAAGVIEKIPAMPVVGNHETYSPERRFSKPHFFTSQFRLPENGPNDLTGQVYSFDYGDVHIAILDSQEGEERSFVPDMLAKQKNWLEADLAATDKMWKIIFIHRPLYGNKPNGVNENLRRAFAGVLDQYGVDLVFTAHDHVNARTWPLDSGGNAAPPGQGVVFAAVGRSGTKTYDNVEQKEWNEFFRNPTDEPDYLIVRVRGGVLQVQVRTQSGDVMDEWKIEKPMRKKEKP